MKRGPYVNADSKDQISTYKCVFWHMWTAKAMISMRIQSDQCLHCPKTESLDNINVSMENKCWDDT